MAQGSRMRVSEFQEHFGKLLTSVARKEKVKYSGFSDVLTFAEKAGLINCAAQSGPNEPVS